MISKSLLQERLDTRILGNKLFVFETIDSTNTCARTLAQAGTEEGAVVLAEFQSEGKGRLGRRWQASAGENLLFSVILRPSIPRSSAGFLTFYASVAVARAIDEACGSFIECKWPNDLLLEGKKVCGILLENSIEKDLVECSVIGVGLNVNQTDFPGELGTKAVSLRSALGRPVDRIALLAGILRSFERSYDEVRRSSFDGLVTEWVSRCRMFGREVTVSQDGRLVTGTAQGLNDDGGLLLRTPDGPRIIYAGDISLHPRN